MSLHKDHCDSVERSSLARVQVLAKVMATEQSGGTPPLADAITDAGGKYTLSFDLEDAIGIKLEATAVGHVTQGTVLVIEPGESYTGQDFALPDAP